MTSNGQHKIAAAWFIRIYLLIDYCVLSLCNVSKPFDTNDQSLLLIVSCMIHFQLFLFHLYWLFLLYHLPLLSFSLFKTEPGYYTLIIFNSFNNLYADSSKTLSPACISPWIPVLHIQCPIYLTECPQAY